MRNVISGKKGSPYSDAIMANGFLFVAGQGPIDEAGRSRTDLSLEEQIRLTMKNLESVLKKGACSLGQVVQCRVYLDDIANFERMNAVYSEYFGESPPVRTTVEAALSDGIAVEIDCVAVCER